MAGDPAESPEAAPVNVDVTYLQAAQAGVVLYLTREAPRPPGGTGGTGYGADVAPSQPDGKEQRP